MATDNLHKLVTDRITELESERASWRPHWQELSRFILPRSGRFVITDVNSGTKRHNDIYDSTATRALRVLGAGLMSGATSPARPWFRLDIGDKQLMKADSVRLWLSDVTKLILDMMARNGTYLALHRMYIELGLFGTAANIVIDHFDKVLHHHVLTCGEYSLATNWMGEVDTIGRQFLMTAPNMVAQFGYENCSSAVRAAYDRGDYTATFTVAHLIEPRRERDANKRDDKNMAFRSVYIEPGSNEKRVLRESGMTSFRALTPRWDITDGDIYGGSPGQDALGDVKQLQHQQLKKAVGIDYQVEPPIQVPTALKGQPQKRLPGGVYFVEQTGSGQGIRSAWEVNINLQHLLMDIQDVRQRVNEAFHKDLFLMLSSPQAVAGKLTATQVAEIHEEKLLMLGPVIERLHNELLQRLVDLAFERLVEVGLLPPPPEELQGQELRVEFVSILAQAQRAVSTNSTDRFVGTLGQIATFKPEVLDKFDADEWADVYADMLGVDPSLIVPDKDVALIRQERSKAIAQQQQQAQAMQQADMANKLAGAPTDGNNALTAVMQGLSGYTTPEAGVV